MLCLTWKIIQVDSSDDDDEDDAPNKKKAKKGDDKTANASTPGKNG